MANSLKEQLLKDGYTEAGAESAISDMTDIMFSAAEEGDLESAYYACEEYGYDPDFIMDLLEY